MAETNVCPDCGAALPAGGAAGPCAGCLLLLAGAGDDAPEAMPAASRPSQDSPAAAAPESFGDYDLLEEIGRGGMGVVRKARQLSLNRLVALKLIKPGMDSGQVLARFDAERQALALMNHPNIARVIDAGTTPHGWPYFVMELVEGVSILRFCDERRLTIRERLELFIQVCQAIQHAHQKGVIHRDIKPSNVLVAEQEGHPIPKVIDFGIAKAIGPRLTPETVATEIGAIIGTLEYMSPEQARLNSLVIDTRSDIYSLGILLYELLTGTTPIDHKTLKQAAFDELLRRIREEEPPKPSTRLNETRATLPAIAAQRGLEPSRLPRLLQGDVDWIVMKALEKDRTRRYDSATALALDVQRYLRDEPVLAGPPSKVYRVGKFVRKHRMAVLGTAACVIGLIAATVISLIMATRALRAERQARSSSAKAQFEEQGRRAVARFYAENIIRPVSPKAVGRARPADEPATSLNSGPNVKLADVLKAAEKRISVAFQAQPLLEAEIRSELGLAFQDLGQYTNAVRQHERALELRRTHARTNIPAILSSLNNLGTAYGQAGRSEEGLRLLEEALRLAQSQAGWAVLNTLVEMNNFALALKDAGRLDEALSTLQRVLRLRRERLGPDDLDSLLSLQNLAVTYHAAGRTNEALPLYEEHYARCLTNRFLGPEHADTHLAMHNLAGIYSEMGDPAKAVPLFEWALEGMRRTLTDRHPDTHACLNGLGAAYFRLRQFDRAVPSFREAYELKRQFRGETHPSTLTSLDNLGVAYMRAGDVTNALIHWERAVTYKRADGAPDLVEFLNYLGLGYAQVKRPAEAESAYREALAIRRKLLSRDHPDVADSLGKLSSVLLTLEKHAEAEPLLRESVSILEQKQPGRSPTLVAQSLLGGALLGQKKYAEAEALLVPAYEGLKKRDTEQSSSSRARAVKEAGERVVQLYNQWGKPDQAAEWRKRLAELPAPPAPQTPAPPPAPPTPHCKRHLDRIWRRDPGFVLQPGA